MNYYASVETIQMNISLGNTHAREGVKNNLMAYKRRYMFKCFLTTLLCACVFLSNKSMYT